MKVTWIVNSLCHIVCVFATVTFSLSFFYSTHVIIKQHVVDGQMSSKSAEVKRHLDLFWKVRRAAAKKSNLVNKKTVRRHATKHPPSLYKVGETVLVQFQSKKWNKVKGKGVSVPKSTTATITKVNHKLNKYKVKADIDGKTLRNGCRLPTFHHS